MAPSDYYNRQPQRPNQPYGNDPYSQQGAYNRQEAALPALPTPGNYNRPDPSPVSPFEGPFDDHVYPARPQESQNSLGQNSSYYGQGAGTRPFDSTNSFRDDIPLQDQSKKDQGTDHVYDADHLPPPNRSSSDGRRVGGFGRFFKKGKGRTAWVVYLFTLIQSAVFIAEIVKNGTYLSSNPDSFEN